ncbi:olfactory receptor 1-like [Cheilinus undulatus]|uniref:olfactory receptor 1-like n=1 Tax=Cheilinus undulatus TaxID=241271 RepID=UPI001BD1F82C|nr:olfactory receptor 1-like [Cheilinus undulatus]
MYAVSFLIVHLGEQILIMGPEEKSAIILNATFVRPAKFYISGFTNMPHIKYYYVFLCFVYIMTVVGNSLLLIVIYLVEALHTPKYMIVFNLAFTDLCGSTALIPKLLDTFLFDRRYIIYEACLSYMFFVLFFASMQSWTLATMAYDRLVAICCPLRYHNIVTKQSTGLLLLFLWVVASSIVAFTVKLIDRLSFCRSLVVKTFFCDHSPVYRLACNDTSLNNIMAYVAFLLFICFPLILIAVTYVCISVALSRIASGEERLKAFKTCTSHLILVAIFFLPILGSNIATVTSNIDPNARMINSSLTHTIPALLNPIIYSLKTEEVLNSFKKLFNRNRIGNTTKKCVRWNSQRFVSRQLESVISSSGIDVDPEPALYCKLVQEPSDDITVLNKEPAVTSHPSPSALLPASTPSDDARPRHLSDRMWSSNDCSCTPRTAQDTKSLPNTCDSVCALFQTTLPSVCSSLSLPPSLG